MNGVNDYNNPNKGVKKFRRNSEKKVLKRILLSVVVIGIGVAFAFNSVKKDDIDHSREFTNTLSQVSTQEIETVSKTESSESTSQESETPLYLDQLALIETDRYTGNEGDSFVYPIGQHQYSHGAECTDGQSYYHGIEAWIARWNYSAESSWAYGVFQLDNKYASLRGQCKLLQSYNTTDFNTSLEFWDGDTLLQSYVITPDAIPLDVNVDVTGCKELKVYFYDNVETCGGTAFALVNMELLCDNVESLNGTRLVSNLTPSNAKGYSEVSEITDCFNNTYNGDHAFKITFSGVNQSCVTFDFNGVKYRTFDYDVSIAESSRDKFVNSDEYTFESDFSLCDLSLVAILSDGSEMNCQGTWDTIEYGFFGENAPIHHTVALPENTVAIRFEGNAWQSYSGVNVIVANANLSTAVSDMTSESSVPDTPNATSSSTISDFNSSLKEVYATSQLATQTYGDKTYVYSPQKVVDNDMSTCWSEGADDYGTGESITLSFDKVYEINEIRIWNGLCASEDLFYKNSRLREISIAFSDGQSIDFECNDGWDNRENIIVLPTAIETSSIVITIKSVYEGEKYKDTCISEISVS